MGGADVWVPVTIDHLFAGIPVTGFAVAAEWWERLIGRPPDLIPNESEAAWRLAGDVAWVYVVADGSRAGNALLTLLVDDLDEHVAELAKRGLAVERMETLRGVGRRAEITDPDGNRITFAEVPPAD
jgi:catechol 2,3-dioxygenase-like lactoylglutathione lyase family enzyme